jgi:hypothetical protein
MSAPNRSDWTNTSPGGRDPDDPTLVLKVVPARDVVVPLSTVVEVVAPVVLDGHLPGWIGEVGSGDPAAVAVAHVGIDRRLR